MNMSILFDEDWKKIENAVEHHPLGSYQIGEIARLSVVLYGRGFDVVGNLEHLCHKYNIDTTFRR